MFFVLSKVLLFLIEPLNWVIGLLVFAVFTKKSKRRKRALTVATVLSIFFTNHFLFNQVIRLWEVKTITMDQIQEPFDIGILLGGYSNPYIIPGNDRHNFNERGNRFFNALELYRAGKVRKLLLTGGSGRLIGKKTSEALQMQPFLSKLGIPPEDIIIEAAARNTYESAPLTKKILDERFPNARCLLITSAWHMPRTKGCFRKEGIPFTPFSVDYIGERNEFTFDSLILPDHLGFYHWKFLIKEWVGYVAYWMRGYL